MAVNSVVLLIPDTDDDRRRAARNLAGMAVLWLLAFLLTGGAG